MICPLLHLVNIIRSTQEQDPALCLQDACAWWDKDSETCSMRSATWALCRIAQNLLIASGHEPPPR